MSALSAQALQAKIMLIAA
ncbi:hypothetical protein [Acidovorax sp. M2(2025)]